MSVERERMHKTIDELRACDWTRPRKRCTRSATGEVDALVLWTTRVTGS